MSEPRPRIQRLRERKERHRRRGRIYRIAFGAAAVVVLLSGLLLSLPGVPGPGLVLVAVGLGMLALEFDRAERLLERILDRLETAAEQATPLQKTVAAFAGVALAALGFAAIVLLEIPLLPG